AEDRAAGRHARAAERAIPRRRERSQTKRAGSRFSTCSAGHGSPLRGGRGCDAWPVPRARARLRVHDRRALSRLRRVPREAAHQGAELYAGDTGLALHLRGVLDADALGREPTVGVWLENLVLNDLL